MYLDEFGEESAESDEEVDEDEGEDANEPDNFRDLVMYQYQQRNIKLPVEQLKRINDALKFYDTVDDIIENYAKSWDDVGYIAKMFTDLTYNYHQNPNIILPYNAVMDPTYPYESMLYMSIISAYANVLVGAGPEYQQILEQLLSSFPLINAERQKAFVLYYAIPIYNAFATKKKITSLDIEVSAAIGDPANPKHDTKIARYLKEKYGDKYYMEWQNLRIRGVAAPLPTVDGVLDYLRKQIAKKEKAAYTPGTLAYKRTADESAERLGKLSEACKSFEYVELITLTRLALKSASLMQICSIIDTFKDRLNFEGACTDYEIEDLLDVLYQLINQLPKFEMCQIVGMLNIAVALPIITGEYAGRFLKVRKGAAKDDLWRLQHEIVEPYSNYQQVMSEYNRIPVMKALLSRHSLGNALIEETGYANLRGLKAGTAINVRQPDGNLVTLGNFLNNDKLVMMVVLNGSLKLRVHYPNIALAEVMLEEGDVLELLAETAQSRKNVGAYGRPLDITHVIPATPTLSLFYAVVNLLPNVVGNGGQSPTGVVSPTRSPLTPGGRTPPWT